MKAAFCLALFALAAFVFAATPEQVDAGVFAGRSGDLVVRRAGVYAPDAVLLTSGDSFVGAEIEDTRVGELLAHVMGTRMLNPTAYRGDFAPLNMFARPKVQLLVAIDGVDTTAGAAAAALPALHGLQATPVRSTAYPQTGAAARLTTMMTGTTPDTHGIVASSWLERDPTAADADVRAYSSAGRPAVLSNLPQAMAASAAEHSLLISVGGTLDVALALSPVRPQRNTVLAYFDAAHQSPVASRNMYTARSFAFTKATLAERMAADAEPALWTPSAAADTLLFAELELAAGLASLVRLPSFAGLLSDASPDFVALGFTSAAEVARVYGADSAQYKRALSLINAAVAAVRTALEASCDGRVSVAAVVLSSAGEAEAAASAVPEPLLAAIASASVSAERAAQYLPSAFLAGDATQRKHACTTLAEVAAAYNLAVSCPARALTSVSAREVRARTGAPSADAAATYHISIWFGVGIVLAVIFAASVIAFMPYTEDPLLFSAVAIVRNK